nr:MAG TPA: hypothetical protein [Caudoviricetes sp.]
MDPGWLPQAGQPNSRSRRPDRRPRRPHRRLSHHGGTLPATHALARHVHQPR